MTRELRSNPEQSSARAPSASACPIGSPARALALCLTCLAFAAPAATSAVAQHNGAPLLRAGEELVYRLRVPGFGTVGRGTMSVELADRVRGKEAYLLRFDLRGRVGFAVVEDRTRSWIDQVSLASLRFEKRERSPLNSSREEVDVFPGERRWVGSNGEEGSSPTDRPLDELSFIYHVRALPLADGDVYYCNLHFDEDRNPVTVRVLGRGTTRVPAGEFSTIIVEMRVQDSRRYRGEGTIKLHLTDDELRIPVRIESPFPIVGTTSLELETL